MKTYRIFLASSFQLTKERDEIIKEVNYLNDRLVQKKVYLELILWEKLDGGNDPVRKQDFYNVALQNCDVLVLLFWAELGLFTNEEYQLALRHFRSAGIPRIYIFKKTLPPSFVLNPQNVAHLRTLEAELSKQGEEQWPWNFEHADTLTKKLAQNLAGLFDDPTNTHFVYGEPARLLSANGIANPSVFLGREDELRTIRKRLGDSGKLMLINAEGGIGKTTLAAKYWHQSLYHYKHNAWLFCENGIVNALKELAPKLDIDLAGMDEAQQIAALKHGLGKVHDEFLLVLDNANNEDDIRVFKQEFAGFHWHVLITSRCNGILDKEQELPITHLPPPLAKDLFVHYYQENTPDFEAQLDKILSAINYHTLLVEIFAKNMREVAELGTNLNGFLQRLEVQGLYLGEESFTIQTDYTGYVHKAAASTDEILDVLYDFSKLTEPQRHLLVNLSLLPAEAYTMLFLIDIFGAPDKKEFHKILKSLHQKGWVGSTEQTYRLSPVVQALALKKNEGTLEGDAQPILDRVNEALKNDAYNLLNTPLSKAGVYAKPVEHFSKCMERHPGWNIADYNYNAGLYYLNIGNIVSAKNCYSNYQSIFQKLLIQEPDNTDYKDGLAASYSRLGGISRSTGDSKNALNYYQEYNRLQKENHEKNRKNLDYKNALAISYNKLGEIFEAKRDLETALSNYQEDNRLQKETHESNPENLEYKNGLAISYQNIGKIFEMRGDWENALINYQEYNRLQKETHGRSPENLTYKNNLAFSYAKLGGVFEARQNWEEALTNYEQSNILQKEVHLSSPEKLEYKNSLAVSYSNLGNLYRNIGDIENALKNFILFREIALAVWQETKGQIVEHAYNYAWVSKELSQMLKSQLLNQQGDLQIAHAFTKNDMMQMRRDGYEAIMPFAKTGALTEGQEILVGELADESWYEF